MSKVEQVYNEQLNEFVDEYMLPVVQKVSDGCQITGMDGTQHTIDTVQVIAANGEYVVVVVWVGCLYPVVIDSEGNLIANQPMISGEVVVHWCIGGVICFV